MVIFVCNIFSSFLCIILVAWIIHIILKWSMWRDKRLSKVWSFLIAFLIESACMFALLLSVFMKFLMKSSAIRIYATTFTLSQRSILIVHSWIYPSQSGLLLKYFAFSQKSEFEILPEYSKLPASTKHIVLCSYLCLFDQISLTWLLQH